jgi:adenosylmethionine-8-amino-7-oxononanoate aminotransferase
MTYTGEALGAEAAVGSLDVLARRAIATLIQGLRRALVNVFVAVYPSVPAVVEIVLL